MTEQAKCRPKRRDTCDPTPPPSTVTKARAKTMLPPPRETKIGKVIALLGREQGATLEEMVKATGWLPHTMRAALTGLRKKGQSIERELRDELTCYRITMSA